MKCLNEKKNLKFYFLGPNYEDDEVARGDGGVESADSGNDSGAGVAGTIPIVSRSSVAVVKPKQQTKNKKERDIQLRDLQSALSTTLLVHQASTTSSNSSSGSPMEIRSSKTKQHISAEARKAAKQQRKQAKREKAKAKNKAKAKVIVFI